MKVKYIIASVYQRKMSSRKRFRFLFWE